MTGDEISPSKDFLQKQNGRFLARECPLYSMRIAISVLFYMRVNFRNGVYARGKEIALQLNSKKKTQFIASTEQNSVATER